MAILVMYSSLYGSALDVKKWRSTVSAGVSSLITGHIHRVRSIDAQIASHRLKSFLGKMFTRLIQPVSAEVGVYTLSVPCQLQNMGSHGSEELVTSLYSYSSPHRHYVINVLILSLNSLEVVDKSKNSLLFFGI